MKDKKDPFIFCIVANCLILIAFFFFGVNTSNNVMKKERIEKYTHAFQPDETLADKAERNYEIEYED